MTSSELDQHQDPSTDRHFTYDIPLTTEITDLQQGDIISKTKEVSDLIEKIHPHYGKDDYTHFIVLTQSCDLVRRHNNLCNAKYITLAAIRPLKLAIEREISKYQNEIEKIAMVCSNNDKFKILNFIERILNNNEPEYFYLHATPQNGLYENSCAFLRLSIAIKAELHYLACLNSRTLSLNDIFKAKLGWLVGNMYSRVGTEDWVPNHLSKQEFNLKIKQLADEVCIWEDEERLKLFNKLKKKLTSKTKIELRGIIKEIVIKTKREKVLDRIVEVLWDMDSNMEDLLANKIYKILESDPEFISYTK